MSFWSFAKPILVAVALAPVLHIVVGMVHQLVVRGQSLKDTLMILVGSPIIFAVLLILSAIPSLIVTGLTAGAMTTLQRVLPLTSTLLWLIAAGGLVDMWIALGRYPDGDGGTMQSLMEQIKSTCAASVVIWCVATAIR